MAQIQKFPISPSFLADQLSRTLVERTHELEAIRRSIAMLQSDAHALGREEALRLIDELQDVEKRLDEIKDVRRFDELKAGLARLPEG